MGLPVLEVKDDLLAAFADGGLGRVLLKAPTGSGKSTVVPKLLLEEAGFEGRIVVVQPRRIAARMLAEYVASLVGSRVGEAVGYSVRFEKVYGPKTRLGLCDGWGSATLVGGEPRVAGGELCSLR